jgi:hypothetical protein
LPLAPLGEPKSRAGKGTVIGNIVTFGRARGTTDQDQFACVRGPTDQTVPVHSRSITAVHRHAHTAAARHCRPRKSGDTPHGCTVPKADSAGSIPVTRSAGGPGFRAFRGLATIDSARSGNSWSITVHENAQREQFAGKLTVFGLPTQPAIPGNASAAPPPARRRARVRRSRRHLGPDALGDDRILD